MHSWVSLLVVKYLVAPSNLLYGFFEATIKQPLRYLEAATHTGHSAFALTPVILHVGLIYNLRRVHNGIESIESMRWSRWWEFQMVFCITSGQRQLTSPWNKCLAFAKRWEEGLGRSVWLGIYQRPEDESWNVEFHTEMIRDSSKITASSFSKKQKVPFLHQWSHEEPLTSMKYFKCTKGSL